MKLDGNKIPTPRENISIEYIEISRSERTITGRLVKDIIAIKRKFSIPYQGLVRIDALIFLDIYKSGRVVEFEFEDLGKTEKASVYIVSLPREIYIPKPEYTQNVTIILEEA